MTVTASSGSPRVSPQLFDTLPLSSVRQAEQQDRFPDGAELGSLTTFFRSGQDRIAAARLIAENAEAIVAKAANRIFVGGTPLSFLDTPLSTGDEPGTQVGDAIYLASDQAAFESSVRTFTGGSAAENRRGLFSRLLNVGAGDADVRVVIPTGFTSISVAKYGPARMRKSVRDLGWFLRYVGYAIVAGDPSILSVNTRGLRDLLEKGCSLLATNVALQEMRAEAAELLRDRPEARRLTVQCFNVLLKELAVPTPSSRQRLGSTVQQGLQLPAIYALASEGAQRFNMAPGLSGTEKAGVIRAAYRQVFERDIAKGYSQTPAPVEATQVAQGKISMREFIRALGRSKEYRQQFFDPYVNSKVVELAYRHFLGRGISSLEEFRKAFSIVSEQGLNGLVDVLVNSKEYAQIFGEQTVPYLRDIGEEAQESAGWGSNRKLFLFSAPFDGAPQYITLYASYRQPLNDQHVYGGGNDPVGNQFGAIFPSGTASVATRPAPYGYDSRRLLIGNGMAEPGQMASPQFRGSRPRKVGPKVVRLQQIATGGNVKSQRGGLPSIRMTEASTQAVINAVYVQVLGNAGYEGERLQAEENRLKNGDINLRDFVLKVASSEAFRRRYWSDLYIVKAIEVMHRRLLGRPTFGRWEIDGLFDTAARHGFYGVVEALINGREYNKCFGEDTVPYERFITPNDLMTRRAPTLCRPLAEEAADYTLAKRPEPQRQDKLRTTADLTPRNLPDRRPGIRGGWRVKLSEAPPAEQWAKLIKSAAQKSADKGSDFRVSLQPTRRSLRDPAAPTRSFEAPTWAAKVGLAQSDFSVILDQGEIPGARMDQALASSDAVGFNLRAGLPAPLELNQGSLTLSSRSRRWQTEIREVLDGIYRQMLNRIPLEDERLTNAESLLRDGQLTVNGFVESVAMSEAFQNRLAKMPPLRAASAATLALLGRAATPQEVTQFVITRAGHGQSAAVQALMNLRRELLAVETNQVPRLEGMETKDGVAQSTVQRTASLYGGNAGLTPHPDSSI
ncbi:MAG: phycobilisome rod-core linker polypeptide [Prochlorococcus sp.]|nr:phycobilisome rod-core linker polypeptide [Prochlorococcaceae cyanobacterium Fu_MAG_50]